MSRDMDLSGYMTVPERIAEFRSKHPEGSLQPANLDRPCWIEVVDGKSFVVYVAAAYRTPDDPRPGVGAAWEPFPGPTNFTRNSELQNAETSAWGRAIVAALAADAKKGIASADEIRNRHAEQSVDLPDPMATDPQLNAVEAWLEDADEATTADLKTWWKAQQIPPLRKLTVDQADRVLKKQREIALALAPVLPLDAQEDDGSGK